MSVTIDSSVAAAARPISKLDDRRAPACLRRAFDWSLTLYARGVPELPPSPRSTGPRVRFGTAEVSRLRSLPALGDELVAFKVTIPVSGQPATHVLLVRRGRARAELVFFWPRPEPGEALIRRLTALTASRLPSGS